jgi:hypothetical protein
MARNSGSVIQNNLSRGLITEATGLNFPDNAVVHSENVIYDPVGSVRRRLGIDLEGQEAIAESYNSDTGVVNEFIWQSVGKNGGFTFLVVQMGGGVNFFEVSANENLSADTPPVGLDLTAYKAPGSQDIRWTPCNFAAGSGYLFMTHPMCDPVIVRWNEETEQFEAAAISIRLRDFEGVEDTAALTENPTTLSTAHHYNLRNQSWNQTVRVGLTSNELGQGGSLGGIDISNQPLQWTPLASV